MWIRNNKRITRLPIPQLGDEAATKNYVLTTMNHLPNLYLDRQGRSKMLGNLQMNNYRTTELTNSPRDDSEAANKKYVDENISKSSIKPSHTPKNVFQYLMDDVNEWTTEYGVKVGSISVLNESPHSRDKKVLNITPVKNGNNYRFRVGLQMFRMKTNESYTLPGKDNKLTLMELECGLWGVIPPSINIIMAAVILFITQKLFLKKTSSSPPVFVYFTIHYDDKSGDLNTYAKEFKNQVYMVAYSVEGFTDHVDSEVYDAHKAFETSKTKMKMLVPLDINNQKILNVNYDLKFGDIFKILNVISKLVDKE